MTPSLEPEPEQTPEIEQSSTPLVPTDEPQVINLTDNTTNNPSEKSSDKLADCVADKPRDNDTENLGDKSTDEPTGESVDGSDDKVADKTVEDVELKSATKEDVPIVIENSSKIHTEYSNFMITAIEYDSGEQTSGKYEAERAAEESFATKRELKRRNIEGLILVMTFLLMHDIQAYSCMLFENYGTVKLCYFNL